MTDGAPGPVGARAGSGVHKDTVAKCPPGAQTAPKPLVSWVRGDVPEALDDVVHRSALVEANQRQALFRLWTVGRFLVEPGSPAVVDPAPGATDADIECFVRGPVAALKLALSGLFTLRGSAVDIGGRALVACGIATGTSSLAAALAMRRHRLVADGVVCVSADPPAVQVVPELQPPRVTLWPDVIKALGLDPNAAEVVRPALPSRAYMLGPPPQAPVPVAALVALERTAQVSHQELAEVPQGFSSVAVALRSLWHPRLVEDIGMAKQQFHWATGLARSTRAVVLGHGRHLDRCSLDLLADAAERLLR